MPDAAEPLPDQWASVEIFGHRQHWGRIREVEQFGTKMLRVEVPTADPAVFESFDYGGAAIFSVGRCTEEAARAWAARKRRYGEPKPIGRLPPPDADDIDDERPF